MFSFWWILKLFYWHFFPISKSYKSLLIEVFFYILLLYLSLDWYIIYRKSRFQWVLLYAPGRCCSARLMLICSSESFVSETCISGLDNNRSHSQVSPGIHTISRNPLVGDSGSLFSGAFQPSLILLYGHLLRSKLWQDRCEAWCYSGWLWICRCQISEWQLLDFCREFMGRLGAERKKEASDFRQEGQYLWGTCDNNTWSQISPVWKGKPYVPPSGKMTEFPVVHHEEMPKGRKC